MISKRIVPLFLTAALLVCGLFSVVSIHKIQNQARVINYAGVVRGATQKLVKEELNGHPNDELVEMLDGLLTELQTGEGGYGLHRLDSQAFQALLDEMQGAWAEMKEEILRVRGGGAADTLFDMSEDYFALADDMVHAAENATASNVQEIETGLLLLIALLLAAAGALMWVSAVQAKGRQALQAETDEVRRRREYLDRMTEALQSPMNDISELIYISDLENYELLFLNETGRRTFHVEGDFAGRKCYEVLQGRDSPCPFCNSGELRPGENYTWEHTNDLTGAHYLLKDRMMEWDGRPARMELAFDMTEAEQRKQELQRALDVEKMLLDCVQTLYQDATFEESANRMLDQLGSFLSAERTYIIMERDGQLFTEYEWCASGVEAQKDLVHGVSSSLMDRWRPIFAREECVVIENVEALREINLPEYEILSAQSIQRLVTAPLNLNGRLAGFLGVDNPPRERMAHVAPLLMGLSRFTTLAWHRDQTEQELSRLSYHDTLTRFYNRNRYMHDVEALASGRESAGILYLDVNGLKDVNDRRGHAAGDRVLARCADLMRAVFDQADLYRIGGDEFVIIWPGADRDAFEEKVRTLRSRFAEDEFCHAAIGARWSGDASTIQRTIADADAEMYEDKKEFYRKRPATNRYRHINDELIRLGDPDVLQEELVNNQFVVYLQPKVSSADQCPQGAEALVRYRPRPDTLVLPGNFLPLLEERHLVSQLDFYVFEFVCAKLREWMDGGRMSGPVSVNFSRCTLSQPFFVEKLEHICEKYGLDKSQLGIELDGSVQDQEGVKLRETAERLRAAGFAVSIDGFGTESANIGLLSTLEFDVLKLNKDMVDGVEDNPKAQAVVASIVDVCRRMGIQLVAEGIETERQLDALRRCGVELVQGFLFSRPIPMEEYEKRFFP